MKEKIRKMFTSPALKDVWHWSRPAHRSLIFISLFTILMNGMSLVITIATRGLIDGATHGERHVLIMNIVILGAAVLLRRGFAYAASIRRVKTNATMLKNLRAITLNGLLTREYASIDKYHSGDLVNRMLSDASTVNSGIMNVVPQLVGMATAFIGASIILITMDWRFVALLIIGGCVGLFLIGVFREPMHRRHRAMKESESRLHIALQETLSNLKLVKASRSEKRMAEMVTDRQEEYAQSQFVSGAFSARMNAGIGLAFQLSWMLTMIWGGIGIYHGQLTYGMLAAIIQLVGQIQSPIAAVADVAAEAYGMLASAERLKELLELPEETNDDQQTDPEELYESLDGIVFDHVSFSYERDESVITEADIKIEKGDFIAITGRSGGGKTTMFQLLMGIYKPTEGEVLFNFGGEQICAGKKTRGLFAYVPQGNTLFSGTIKDNIAMFTDRATDEAIRKAAQLACIDGFIDSLDDDYNTKIGERGIGLSEGQAQRIAVARALLSNAPILLLDEATSALDERTEAQLLKNIATLRNKTCLIVTHRRAALSICDRIISIEDKRAAETGKVTIL